MPQVPSQEPPKPVDRGPVSPPGRQTTPGPRPVYEPRDIPQVGPRGGENTGQPEGKGSHDQQGELGGLPDEVGTHTPENGGAEAPRQSEVHTGQGTVHEPDNGGGQLPSAVGVNPRGDGYEGTTANKPAGGTSSGTGMVRRPDRGAASAALPDHEPASDARSTEGMSSPPVKAAADAGAPPPTAVRGEDTVRPAGHSPAVGAASTAASGGPSPAAYGVRAASETPFGSTEYFFGYLWNEDSISVQQDPNGLGPMQDFARDFRAATSHGGSLTQQAPRLPLPSPFSGFGLTMGGAVFGASSSGDGYAPLLAVIFCCLAAVLWRGRPRAYGALLRAGTVPRLAVERPG